ncbi:hypothetical protein LEP1GSC047_0270 [Leptospira inadai serovar Lyme str. 10]|uniref:Uncharacterized protein n=1 Tax=Leptospira inadai serovar Lyme str. 10 TaxID=1049790 RepID=V6H9E5_9LEPT|nr:hypothetical protein LEP1GSC047_0270 [Leptospira inadai serovar Lyme str. 10]
MLFKYNGSIGYSISLAISVNKLMNDRTQIDFVIVFIVIRYAYLHPSIS